MNVYSRDEMIKEVEEGTKVGEKIAEIEKAWNNEVKKEEL